jgi:ribose-phosphate pyrophosphokinase
MVFSGNANLQLASDIALDLGVPMGKAIVGRFSDGEVMIEIMENIRTREVYVIQSTCAPTADNFMELLVMVDALKRASASKVTAIIPYFGLFRWIMFMPHRWFWRMSGKDRAASP